MSLLACRLQDGIALRLDLQQNNVILLVKLDTIQLPTTPKGDWLPMTLLLGKIALK